MFGPGVASFSFFVVDKNGHQEARITNKGYVTPVLGFETHPRHFWSRHPWFRGSRTVSASSFKADHQNNIDLGTKISGYMGYINPTLLFYYGSETFYAYAGIGIGAGIANLEGSYYNTDGRMISSSCKSSYSAQDIISNCQKEKVKFNDVGLSTNVMLVISLGWFGAKVEAGGPSISADGKKYSSYNSMFSFFGQYRF
jgi:hypothetical protein